MAVKQNLPTLKFDDILNVTGGGTPTPPKTVTPTTVTPPTYSELAGGKVQPTNADMGVKQNLPTLKTGGGTTSYSELTPGNQKAFGDVRNGISFVTPSNQKAYDVMNPTPVRNEQEAIVSEGGNSTNTGTDTKPTFEEWYKQAKADAKTNKSQAVIDAKNAYDQNKSEYGSNAAALSAMGLTGSGYSDYLNARAYGQMQGDVNAADRTYQQAIADADYKYMQYVEKKEADQKSAYTSLYNDILTDPTKMSEADIDNLAAQSGITDATMISQLKAARKQGITALLDSNEYTKADLDRLLNPNSEEYQKYLTKLTTNMDLDSADLFKEDGQLINAPAAKNTYNSMKEILEERIRYLDAQAQASTDDATKASYTKQASEVRSQLAALTSNYNARYSTDMQNVKVHPKITFDRDFAGGDAGDDENHFTLAYDTDDGTNVLRVEYNGKDLLKTIKEGKLMAEKDAFEFEEALKEKVSDGGVFMYTFGDGTRKYYVRRGDKFYEIVARDDEWLDLWNKPTSWNDLTNAFNDASIQ